jgi:hypothetical protein
MGRAQARTAIGRHGAQRKIYLVSSRTSAISLIWIKNARREVV